MITENLNYITNEINNALLYAKREDSVKLIAISKTKPVEMIEEAYKLGCRDFGENKVQELVAKYEVLPKDIKWHMVGHLQRNKVKYIIDKVDYIHSVDTYELAVEIDRQAAKKNIGYIKILLEVNVAMEDSKFGIHPNELEKIVDKIKDLQHVKICGLMTVAPYVSNPDDNIVIFSKLNQLLIDIIGNKVDNDSRYELSMGMSNDYQCAIHCGATMIRIGSDLFGNRNYL